MYLNQIETAAIDWWEGRRPAGWSIQQHVSNPTINCTTDAEKALALAVARLTRVSQPADCLKSPREIS